MIIKGGVAPFFVLANFIGEIITVAANAFSGARDLGIGLVHVECYFDIP